MAYKKGDGIRVIADALGQFARHKGRRGEILLDGPRMVSAQGHLVIGSGDSGDRMIFGYSVRLYADKPLHWLQDDMTIPADCLELVHSSA